MRSVLRNLSIPAALLGILLAVSACDNTIRGIGADVRETGDAVEDATS